ncbi:MAG: hypothetical protein OXD54_09805 [Candidatus Poribacteria bacterium]|nr:hypothetical protein [Candidatus Poribacteria bacterium]
MRSFALLLFFILIVFAIPCNAIFEGTANANIFISIYKQRGDFGRLALWHEAAAECLNLISIPMNDILYNYYKRNGYEKWVERTEKETLEIQEQRQFHLKRAEAAWKRSQTNENVLNSEREKIAKFMKTWLPHYPDRFFKFGIYATFFKEQQERAEQKNDYAKVLRLEAEAAEMCAAQYEKIPIAYGLESYTKIRDAYLKHATLLRTLAKQTPKKLPDEVDIGKQIQLQKPDPTISPKKKAGIILHTAKSDPRIKTVLANQKGVREYAWFQGFAWTVSFYNHSWGNLAIVVIDDNTGKVIDILIGKRESEKLNLVD